MPIGYSNAAGACVRSPALDAGHWYAAGDGGLYIVPTDGEVEGPDDEANDRLEAVYRASDFSQLDPFDVAAQIGLEVVPDWQQLFDPLAGYYLA